MRAGQGIVQFARGVTDGLDYALKFFISKSAFDAEGELYRDPVLGPLLPKIEGLSGNEGGEVGDAHGTPLPPFIAMEKGEALDEWSRRAKPDLFQSVAVRFRDACAPFMRRPTFHFASQHPRHASRAHSRRRADARQHR